MKLKHPKILILAVAVFVAAVSLGRNVSAINTPAEGYRVPVSQTVDVWGPENEPRTCKKVTNNCPNDIFVPTKSAAEWTGDASRGFLTHVPSCASVAECINCDVDGDTFKNKLATCDDCDLFDHYSNLLQYRELRRIPFWAFFNGRTYPFTIWAFNGASATADGGFVVLGGYGDDSNPGYIAKFDCSGNKQWSRIYASTRGGFWIEDIETTADGGFVAAGNGGFSGTLGDNDGVIMKVDKNGKLSWVRYFERSEDLDEKFVRITQTSDGGYLATGFLLNSSGDQDGYVVKVDAFGTKIWSKKIKDKDGSNNIFGYNLTGSAEYQGNYIIVGRYGDDAFITSLNSSNGVENWSKKISFDGSYIFEEVIRDGAYFVAAGSSQTTTEGIAYGVVYKFNSSGQRIWSKKLDTIAIHDIEKSSDGKYILAGTDGSKGFVGKVDSNGGKQWFLYMPAGEVEGLSAGSSMWEVIQLKNGDYITVGYSTGCDFSSSCYGSQDKPWNGGSIIHRITGNPAGWDNDLKTWWHYGLTTGLSIVDENAQAVSPVFSNLDDEGRNAGSYVEDPPVLENTDVYDPASCQPRTGC